MVDVRNFSLGNSCYFSIIAFTFMLFCFWIIRVTTSRIESNNYPVLIFETFVNWERFVHFFLVFQSRQKSAENFLFF